MNAISRFITTYFSPLGFFFYFLSAICLIAMFIFGIQPTLDHSATSGMLFTFILLLGPVMGILAGEITFRLLAKAYPKSVDEAFTYTLAKAVGLLGWLLYIYFFALPNVLGFSTINQIFTPAESSPILTFIEILIVSVVGFVIPHWTFRVYFHRRVDKFMQP